MTRHKPTKKSDVVGKVDLYPEEAVGDYVASRLASKCFILQPDWESAGDSIELCYVQTLREYEKTKTIQRNLLRKLKDNREKDDERIRKVSEMQDELHKRFIEVNAFMRDSAEKQRVANATISNEVALHDKLQLDIEKLQTSIPQMLEFRKELEETVTQYQRYEKLLDDVVAASDIFVTPADCMARCDALMLAQVEISRMSEEKRNELEAMRNSMVKITTDAAESILEMKNQLTQLLHSYDKACKMRKKWEIKITQCKTAIAAKELDKERTMNGIMHLVVLLCKRRGKAPIANRGEVEKSMDFIKSEIELLTELAQGMES